MMAEMMGFGSFDSTHEKEVKDPRCKVSLIYNSAQSLAQSYHDV